MTDKRALSRILSLQVRNDGRVAEWLGTRPEIGGL